MKNDHSSMPRKFSERIASLSMNNMKYWCCVYVNPDNNMPILWRFFSMSGSVCGNDRMIR
jgi:hypothetical protein